MNRNQMRKSERGTRNEGDRLRALNVPQLVEVALDAEGMPVNVKRETLKDSLTVAGNWKCVEALSESWRIDDEWWRQPIVRRYVEVVLEGGGRLVLFEDQITGEWFAQMPT